MARIGLMNCKFLIEYYKEHQTLPQNISLTDFLKNKEEMNKFIVLRMGNISYPSKRFEFKSRLTGLHCEWKIPNFFNLNEEELQSSLIMVRDTDYLDAVYDEFVRKNPEAKEIPFSTRGCKYEIVMGMISRFVKSDIDEFVNIGGWADRKEDKKYKDLHDRIERQFGFLGWVASIQTLKQILNI